MRRIKILVIMLSCVFIQRPSYAQNYEIKSVAYNTLVNGFVSGVGAVINSQGDEKKLRSFFRGFMGGAGGGALMYAGKKANRLVSLNRNLGYGWLARVIFSAGNSVTENASAGRPLFSQWHFDIGFIRLQYNVPLSRFRPMFMPSAFGGFLFEVPGSRWDIANTLRSGTLILKTGRITYADHLQGSTTGNNFLLVDTLKNDQFFYELIAHENIHTFQFQELSGINYYLKPAGDGLKKKNASFEALSQWIYLDLNYEAMLLNYFIIQGGYKGVYYCRNFLENEAEYLSTGRASCP
jgi:hypothetical protein